MDNPVDSVKAAEFAHKARELYHIGSNNGYYLVKEIKGMADNEISNIINEQVDEGYSFYSINEIYAVFVK